MLLYRGYTLRGSVPGFSRGSLGTLPLFYCFGHFLGINAVGGMPVLKEGKFEGVDGFAPIVVYGLQERDLVSPLWVSCREDTHRSGGRWREFLGGVVTF